MFVIEAIVKGGVVHSYIVMRGISFVMSSLFTYVREKSIRKICVLPPILYLRFTVIKTEQSFQGEVCTKTQDRN